jgi:hypothetical protein
LTRSVRGIVVAEWDEVFASRRWLRSTNTSQESYGDTEWVVSYLTEELVRRRRSGSGSRPGSVV